MKKILSIVMMISLLLVGCTVPQIESEPQEDALQPSAFSSFAEPTEDDVMLIVNQPTVEQLKQIQVDESIELSTDGEEILLIPKERGTYIQIWSLRYEDDELRRNDLIYEKQRTEDDFVLQAKLMRPDTIPHYMMVVQSKKGYSEYVFSDNLKDGLPEIERIKATKKTAEDKFSFYEMGYMFTNTKEDLITLFGEPVEEQEILFFDDVALKMIYEDSMFELDGKVYQGIIGNNKIDHPRGVRVGDSMESVLAKFPNEGDDTRYSFDENDDREYSMLYGEYVHMQDFGMIEYVNDIPLCITYSHEGSTLVFELEDKKVVRVRYELPLT